jgi:hypothetical protein
MTNSQSTDSRPSNPALLAAGPNPARFATIDQLERVLDEIVVVAARIELDGDLADAA